MRSPLVFIILILMGQMLTTRAFATQEAPQTFTFDGRAFSNTTATTPLLDNISFRVQILNQAQDCILYEEQQSLSTATTDGYFTIQVGSVVGALKRSALDSAHPMSVVFSNTSGSISGKLVSNGAACSYSPIAANVRYLRLLMTPSDNVTRTISPNMALDSVPLALVAERAETLQGFYPTDFLNINNSTAVLTQANAENIFSSTNYSRLTSLLSVPPANYVQTGANGSAALPVVNGNPSSGLTAGQIWYDSGSNVLKYYDGSVKTLGTSGGSVTSVATGTGLSGGPITTTGTISLANTTVTAGTYGSATQVPSYTVDAQGRITSANNVTITTGANSYVNGGNSFAGNATLGTNDNYSLAFKTNNTTQMTLDTSGRLGIGTTTPAAKLDVLGANGSAGAAPMALKVTGGTGAASFAGGDIQMTSGSGNTTGSGGNIILTSGASGASGTAGYIQVLAGDSTTAAAGGYVQLKGGTYGGAGSSELLLSKSNSLTTGSVLLRSGPGNGIAGASGTVTVQSSDSGVGMNSSAGTVSILGGNGDGTGSGGAINITAGNGGATNVAGSNIVLNGGAKGGTAADGNVILANTRGNVGIGTTTPTSTLSVNGNISAVGGITLNPGTTTNLIINKDSNLSGGYTAFGDIRFGAGRGYDLIFQTGGSNHAIIHGGQDASTNSMLSFSTDVEAIRINSAGNVGIGTATPNALLDVNGTMRVSQICDSTGANCKTVSGGWNATAGLSAITAATGTDTIDNTNYAQTWNWSTATTQNPMSLTANALTTGTILNVTSSDASLNSTNGLLNVANTGASTNGLVARIQSNSTAGSGLTVLANGNVGIGTTIPNGQLSVESGNSGGPGGNILIRNTSETVNSSATLKFKTTFDNSDFYQKGSIAYVSTGGYGKGDMYFMQNSAADASNATLANAVMVIANTGKVGIGNTNPATSLDVTGKINASTSATSGNVITATNSDTGADLTYGVYASTASTATGTSGVYGLASGSGGYVAGVVGYASATGGYGTGVAGKTEAQSGIGVSGIANYQWSGYTSFGGDFEANGPDSYGVLARNNSTSGNSIALYTTSPNNASGYALYSASGQNYFAGKVGVGTASPSEKLTVAGNINTSTGQIYAGSQTSSAASPLTFDANGGNLMVWTTAAASPTVNINNMKAGGSYMLVVNGSGTGTVTINCFSGVGTGSLPSSFIPVNGARTNGTLNKSVYTLISDGTNCLVTWITGF